MGRRVTIRDVAAKTGYSAATVSLALRDSPHLPEATRTRVRCVAEELGYRPDPLLAAIAARRWHGHPAEIRSTIAVISDADPSGAQKMEGWNGLERRARSLGYQITHYRVQDYPDAKRLSTLLYNRGVLGILVGQIFAPRFCAQFDWSHFASVAISEGAFRPPIHLVMPNHFHAVQQAWDYAREQGCRRIGMALFDIPTALDMHDRHAAFQDRQTTVPRTSRIPVLSLPSDHIRSKAPLLSADSSLAAWIEQHRPDAILGFNDGFQWTLEVVGYAGAGSPLFISLWKQRADAPWPGLLLPVDEIGARAVDWIDSLLRSGERGLPTYPATMEIEMRWVAPTQTATG